MTMAFLTVGEQVLILFLLTLAGFILGRLKLIDDRASLGMSNLVMYVVSPCMMVVAFQRDKVAADLHNFLLVLGLSVVMDLISILLARLCVRDSDTARQRALQFAAVFSNCGFMGYPLMLALLGTIGVYFGSAYVMLFNILTWTWGVWVLTGDKKYLSPRPVLLNPGVISAVIAMALYLLSIRLPPVLLQSATYFSTLNTPLPMVVLGYQLSRADLKGALRGAASWVALGLRLVILPLLALGLCLVTGLERTPAIVLVIAVSTPCAAALTMFAVKFKGDAVFSSSFVSLSTVLSVLTMPLVVGLAEYLL